MENYFVIIIFISCVYVNKYVTIHVRVLKPSRVYLHTGLGDGIEKNK